MSADPNLVYLDARLQQLKALLSALESGAHAGIDAASHSLALARLEGDAQARGVTLTLPRTERIFGLSRFERDVLLLAAAPDIDAEMGELIARLQPPGILWPTVGLLWRLLCADRAQCIESRDAFREDAPLLRFELVQLLDPALPLPCRAVRIEPRIADELCGRTAPDARLSPFLRARPHDTPLAREPLARSLADAIGRFLREPARPAHLVIALSGATPDDLEALARGASALAGLPLLSAHASTLPPRLATTFVRESILLPAAVFIDGLDADADHASGNASSDAAAWLRALADAGAIVFLATRTPTGPQWIIDDARWLSVPVAPLDGDAREQAWCACGLTPPLDQPIARMLGERFDLDESRLRAAAREAASHGWLHGRAPAVGDLLDACQSLARHRMGDLSQSMPGAFERDDLLLPEDSLAKLRELEAHVTHGPRVFDTLGFAARQPRGRGVSALFAGPSGTGKTMAAQVLARALGRELYRVDLARMVSKYIGETEKNLRTIFAEAEHARCVLLFDEADALFGKRTEVRDSHDRYANLEVSYLLQLLEDTQHAVVLLATNRRDAIDGAFLRRFRFVIDFPMPDAAVRLAMWRTSFPRKVDTSRIRFEVLADRLPVSGASIKSIALGATFLAVRENDAMTPAHVLHAVRRELEKLARPMPLREQDLTAGAAS